MTLRGENSIRQGWRNLFAPGFDHGALVFGVGNHGGGPTKAQLAALVEMSSDPSLPVEIRFSTYREFFAAVERSPAMKDLPVVRTELEHVFRGCYAAMGEVKWLNRRAERSLMTAETMASLAHFNLGWKYPAAGFDHAWWLACFNEFHDTLAGTALESAYVETRDKFGAIAEFTDRQTLTAVEALSRRVDTSQVKEGALFCFNPLPWPRTATVEMELFGDSNPKYGHDGPTAAIRSSDGSVLPLQARTNVDPRAPDDPYGLPEYFVLKQYDTGRRFAARVTLPACGYRMFEIMRQGPVSSPPPPPRLAVGTKGGIEALSADDLFVDWSEPQQILMLEVPTALASDRHVTKIAGGSIVRPSTGEEEPGQDWVALEGKLGTETYSVALLNAQSYSYNCKGGRLRTIIVRSATWTRDFDHLTFEDLGHSQRRFGLIAAKGPITALNLERKALEFQTPIEYVEDSVHPGTEPWEKSFLEIGPANVSVTAIKRAQAGEDLIVRLQETKGLATKAAIRSPVRGWAFSVPLAPRSIATVAIARADSAQAEFKTLNALELA